MFCPCPTTTLAWRRLRTTELLPTAAVWLCFAYALNACQTPAADQQQYHDKNVLETSSAFRSDEEIRSWLAHYYRNPDPERVNDALYFMARHGYFVEQPDVAAVFFGKVFAANSHHLGAWSQQWQDMGETAWQVIMMGLWLADTADAKRTMSSNSRHLSEIARNRLAYLVTKDPRKADPLALTISDPHQINLLWAAFSATGDDRYVRKVVSYIQLYGVLAGEDSESVDSLIGEVAMMSLTQRASQHDRVAEICRNEHHVNSDPKTRLLLQTMFNVLAQMQLDQQLLEAYETAH